MPQDSEQFKACLDLAIRSLKRIKNKDIGVIEDELGYALGREGRSAVQYWRKGNIPPQQRDVEDLARQIIVLGYRDAGWLHRFLSSAAHPDPRQLCDELLPDADLPDPESQQAMPPLPQRRYHELVGRDEDVDAILAALHDDKRHWIIGIDGMGGIGKTALAREVIERSLYENRFEAILWLDASPQSTQGRPLPVTFDYLLDAIGVQLRNPELIRMSPPEKEERTRTLLQRQRLLIVLDNLETAADPQAEIIQRLHRLLGPSKALVTSRRRFENEVYPIRLRGLTVDGAQRFLEVEAEQRRMDQLLNATQDELQQITEKTGGSPLALKLVVGQLAVLPLPVVLEQLRLPNMPTQDDDEYVRLYENIFARSWQLLHNEGRGLLIAISHFPAYTGGTFAALQRVSGLEEPLLAQTLTQLWRFSLLEAERNGNLSSMRYGLHALTRHFVQSEVAQSWLHSSPVESKERP
ncbi:hypothetical protein GC175_29110 [bacterium]|nr:hypothetical protein [bacterium]